MASHSQERPNILLVLTDDHGHWAMGCAGNGEVRTPHLDRLAATGLRFENLFCASPVCSPARASLLTGRIPSQHGVHDWIRAGDTHDVSQEPDGHGRVIEYLQRQPGYTDVLAEAGYLCGLSGKWHLGSVHRPQRGFTYWNVHAKGGGPYYRAPMVEGNRVVPAEGYVTEVITDHALAFLNEQALTDERPFYLGVHYTAPHSPWQREHHPADLWDSYHEHCPFRSVPSALQPPAWAQRISIPVKDEQTRRVYLSGYFAAITAMDAQLGRLLDWLEEHDLRSNTLVLFTSDNGMSMGHHGVFGKGNATFPMNMFDTAVKVPGIVSRPGFVPRGCICDALVSHYDIKPTLLDYVGLESPNRDLLPGRSFAQLLRGAAFRDDDEIVILDEYGPVRMIRNRYWKYVHRYPYGPHELYHLRNDPEERTNLVDCVECADHLRALRRQLQEWFLRYVDPRVDGIGEPVTGRGQIDRAGIGALGRPNFL
ncbi:MAG: sulfatase-like hydrolase/transferase [Lentisphaeria bacterium]|nr:sulfatase-like hydrolase/transferase [Lentisphaeria bacterium]